MHVVRHRRRLPAAAVLLAGLLAALAGSPARAQQINLADEGYILPPKEVADVVLSSLSPTAKHVATARRMVQTTTQPHTLDVPISTPARISEVVAEKSAKDEVVWEVEKSHPWMS